MMSNRQKTEFWRELSEKSNYMEPEVVKTVYYGFLKVIIANIRKKGVCEVPDWGIFKLHDGKDRFANDAKNPGQRIIIPGRNQIKFKPGYKLRTYMMGIKTND